ncbi:MAG: glycosyl hydrolase family 18 protein [Luteolibacter sp.]|uniref:glycosyl hydrolase family 18 protein n=1 Tax=Luteolibacter sp. TaxID=1962973 RepID=UPI003266731E
MKSLIAPLVFLLLATPSPAKKVVVAYVPNWIDLERFSKTINYSKLTHINIAFENPVDATGKLSFNKQDDAIIARAHAKNVKVLVSLGGGSASGDEEMKARYFDLLGEKKRAAFVNSIAAYVIRHGFDGVDVDLEGPSINEDYGSFIRALSNVLKPSGKLLTAALSQGYGGNKVPASVFKQYDLLNIMAYDATGNWDPSNPGQHSSLAYAKSNVTYWLGRGLPKSKVVLGVPFYGYGFGDAYRADDGYSYAEIVAAYPGAENLDQVGSTIWYNGIPTIQAKTQYVIDRNLAGVMIWSLDNDAPGAKSLLNAIDRTLH